ncbi:MAG: glycosyltransferase [Candidatus Diapherotrites archaeon]|uniref:Glycosyltransferase n=1 Tax=Candidatus Iainarchaeum sp. TaxID=3101447 RepID=A0A8T4C5G5_9ARCH|nr:glycosyltransferase [Candidatus Diapherotrites archaeon]
MIFVSVGTHPDSFSRLLNEVVRLREKGIIRGKIIIQSGYTPFTHHGVEVHPFMNPDVFEKTIREADVFITHAGEGNMGWAIQGRIPMVIVPRRKKYGEHTNDHQLELARAAEKEKYGVVVYDIENLSAAIQRAQKNPPLPVRGHVIPSLKHAASELEVALPTTPRPKSPPPKTASIVVATLNGGEPLIKAIHGMLSQQFAGKYEVIVVDDGSFDGVTPSLLKKNFAHDKRVTLLFLPRSGVCKARNAGIRAAKYEVVINMDHDDNPEPDWLQIMVNGFDSPRVGAVSAYGHYGGTSTGFRKDLLDYLGGYDEDFFYYREDTDLSFRIIELGYEYVKVNGAKWHGDRTLVTPKTFQKIILYTLQRFKYHMNDVLLHQKHAKSKLCNTFLHVRGGFIVDPVVDFKVATGLWNDAKPTFELSSPRGMTFIRNQSMLHFLAIVMLGICYAFAIKWARLAGSIKHGHLLV